MSGFTIERIVAIWPSATSNDMTENNATARAAEDQAGLTVDLLALHRCGDPAHLPGKGREDPGNPLRADNRLGPLRDLPAAVAVDLHVLGEQRDQPVHVAVL